MEEAQANHSIDKWRQGHILPPELGEKVGNEASHPDLRSLGSDGVWVLVSQDCDLVQPSLKKEPFAEAIYGIPIAEKKQIGPTNSPRGINLRLNNDENGQVYLFDDRNRVRFPRQLLCGCQPDSGEMARIALGQLIRMILRRYDRHGLPTAFNDRLQNAKVHGAINRLLKDNVESLSKVSIYIRLDTTAELTDGDYRVLPLAVWRKVHTSEKLTLEQTVEKELFRSDVADKIMNGDGSDPGENSSTWAMAKATGIIGLLKECEINSGGIRLWTLDEMEEPFRNSGYVLPNSLISLDYLEDFKPWDFDFLSPSEDDSKPIIIG